MVIWQVPVKAEVRAQEALAPILQLAETSQRKTKSDISHKKFCLCSQVERAPSHFAS